MMHKSKSVVFSASQLCHLDCLPVLVLFFSCTVFFISNLSEISFGGVYSNSRDIFIAELAENALFHHLSQAFYKVLTGAHMGKGRSCAASGEHLDRFVLRAPVWVSWELISPTTSPQAEKLLPNQAGTLEVPDCRKQQLFNRHHCVFMQRERRKKEKEKAGRLESGRVWFLRKAAASCWTPLKEKGCWQHPLPTAAGIDTISHSGHC